MSRMKSRFGGAAVTSLLGVQVSERRAFSVERVAWSAEDASRVTLHDAELDGALECSNWDWLPAKDRSRPPVTQQEPRLLCTLYSGLRR